MQHRTSGRYLGHAVGRVIAAALTRNDFAVLVGAELTRSAPLFGLFKSPPFHDPKLGELVRSRGFWRGLLTVEAGVRAPLAVSGMRTEPHAQALAAAREVAQAFASLRPAIEQALFEHYEPYAEAVTAGELPSPSEALPRIAAPGDVWSHVSLVFVSVTPLSGLLTTELGYTTAWDDEHTLGARFQSGKFMELCGSVLRP
jgi:hypothetical protein